MPEQNPEEKVLAVNVVTLGGYQKQCGELVLTAQIKQQPVRRWKIEFRALLLVSKASIRTIQGAKNCVLH